MVGNDAILHAPGIKILISGQLVKTNPRLDKPNHGSLKIYASENRHKVHQIYKHCVDLESLCIEYGKSVYSLQIKVRVLEGDGLLLGFIVDGINRVLEAMKVPVHYYPKAFVYTSVDKSAVADPLKAEVGSEVFVVLAKDVVLLAESSGEECNFDAIAACVRHAIERPRDKFCSL